MNESKLWVTTDQIEQIIIDIENHHPYETGGVLMGYTGLNGDVVVTDIIYSGPNAIHKRYSFCPDQEYQLEQIANIFYESNRSVNYLGDWHSHPNTVPDLSMLDKRTLTKIALTPESKCPNPIMVIFGEKPNKWTINAVRFQSGKIRIWPFSSCKYEYLQLFSD